LRGSSETQESSRRASFSVELSGEQQIMHIVERGRDFAGEQGGARERGVAVVFDQTQEAVALHKLDLANLDGGNRDQ